MSAISRAGARASGLKRYLTGKPCKHGHVVERYVSGQCVLCAAVRVKEWTIRSPGRAGINHAAWRKLNPRKVAAFSAAWSRRNPDKKAAIGAVRRGAKLRRIPPWADRAAIMAVFEEAKRLTAETGVPHEVDHEIPLQGELVSGLHTHANLCIRTRAENRRKGNKFRVAA
jgi:hypothetical protein